MARYLVTGGAGFIGSNLVHALLEAGHEVRVIDDFSTGRRENLEQVADAIELFEGSICDTDLLARAFDGVEFCLHEAAIPSVPRSVEDPAQSNRANVDGTLNVFLAARDAGAKRVVYASSSSVYGNTRVIPAHEDLPLDPISPYGVTKAANELYAAVFSELYDIEIVGLRYFNVFGPRQDPASQYAAVIPIFVTAMLAGNSPPVDGDGLQSRDFSYIENVVQANRQVCERSERMVGVYNVACGATTSILELVDLLNDVLGTSLEPMHRPSRPGDIHTSYADIAKARTTFGYEPTISVREGLERTVEWYQTEEKQS